MMTNEFCVPVRQKKLAWHKLVVKGTCLLGDFPWKTTVKAEKYVYVHYNTINFSICYQLLTLFIRKTYQFHSPKVGINFTAKVLFHSSTFDM